MNELEPRDAAYKHSIITVPNLICFFRLFGSMVLILLAVLGWRYGFVVLFIALSLSDWIDGKLARWLKQRSDFGAQLDSTADAAMYIGLLGGGIFLSWQTLWDERYFLIVGLGSYVLTTGLGWWKYGRTPSYHTYGAKFTQWLALIGGATLILEWTVWPLRITMISLLLTNLEAVAITCVLPKWRADVLTLFHVWPTERVPPKDSKEDSAEETTETPPAR
jgi:CDP-diacylglycerol--glycerol-3-phosphate 3-phosphatidyltransferase